MPRDNGLPAPTWEGSRRRDALRRVKADGARHDKPCCLCGAEIDYSLEYPHPMSCSVEHTKSRAEHPELTWDWANMAPAHLQCNKRAPRGSSGTGQPRRTAAAGPDDGLGVRSPW